MKPVHVIRSIAIVMLLVLSGCDKDDDTAASDVEVCWRIVDQNTGDPIEGAHLHVEYDYSGSKLGPFLITAYSNTSGVACATFPPGYNIMSGSAAAPGYMAMNFNFGYIPSVIELQPQEE